MFGNEKNTVCPLFYTVKSGECLSVLAEQYGTTTKALATLNGIKDINDIKAGQVLKIGTYTTTYTVKASAAEYKASQGLPNDATTVVK
jgi:membrane-bound lytic murein transglycosylase D